MTSFQPTVATAVVAAGTVEVTFTQGATGPAKPQVDWFWDLDNDGDFSESVEDITDLVLDSEIVTGRDYPSQRTGRATPGTARVRVKNETGDFNYFNSSSSLATSPFSLKNGRMLRAQIHGVSNPNPSLLSMDRMDGSGALGDDELGNTWDYTSGITWTRANGAITPDGAAARASIDLGSQSTIYCQARFTYVDGTNQCGILYRYTDGSNTGYVFIDGNGSTIRHNTVIGGSVTNRSTEAIEIPRGHFTLGVEINSDNDVTVYLEGVPLFTDTGAAASGSVGSGTDYGVNCYTTAMRYGAVEDWRAWDGIWTEVEGILFTGDITGVMPAGKLNGLDTALVEAEGWLARLAGPEVTPPSSVGALGDSPAGVTAGLMVGATLAAADQLNPPPPGGLDPGQNTLGGVGRANAKALTVARDFEATEGFILETPEGPVTYQDSSARDTGSPIASLSDNSLDQFQYSALELLDWQREIVNRVELEVSPLAATMELASATAGDGGSGSVMSVDVTYPSSSQADAGNLLLLCVILTGQIAGEELVTPPGWTKLTNPGQRLGAQHWYAKKLVSSELTATPQVETFYTASTTGGGVAIYQWHVIDDWLGSIEGGVVASEPTGSGSVTESDAQAGTHELPVLISPWDRQPTLWFTSRSGCYTDSSGSVSYSEPDDLPNGWYNGNSTFQAGTVSTFDAALQIAYTHAVAEVMAPSDFGGTFTGFNVLECVTLAVRGYCGDPPEKSSGEIVIVEDLDSQWEHNRVASWSNPGTYFASATAADTEADSILATGATPRPLFKVGFWANKSASYRWLAYTLRVGRQIRLVAENDSNMGVNALYWVESIHHKIGIRTWWVELTVSPVD